MGTSPLQRLYEERDMERRFGEERRWGHRRYNGPVDRREIIAVGALAPQRKPRGRFVPSEQQAVGG